MCAPFQVAQDELVEETESVQLTVTSTTIGIGSPNMIILSILDSDRELAFSSLYYSSAVPIFFKSEVRILVIATEKYVAKVKVDRRTSIYSAYNVIAGPIVPICASGYQTNSHFEL